MRFVLFNNDKNLLFNVQFVFDSFQEISYLQEELTRQKIDLSSKLKERETEIKDCKVNKLH